ncbi:MAG: hypothetical protein WBH44_00855 [Proteocatella sp.]
MFIRKDRNTKSADLAFMGIMLAINQILLYFGGMTSFNETFFLALASLLIGIVVIEKGIKNGIVFFISSAMMALIIMPNKLNALGYVFILGTYTIVKYYIEKIDNFKKENVVKALYFTVVGLIASIAANRLLFSYSIMIIFPMFVIIMTVYDYAATVLLTSYRNKFKLNRFEKNKKK